MKWPNWRITRSDSGDFLPILFGGIMVFVSFPAFILLLVFPDRNSEIVSVPLAIMTALGTLLGSGFIVLGVRVCSMPGSLAFRITHGRIFGR